MGDWAQGEFQVAGQVAGKDYSCLPGLGVNKLISTGGDAFYFPKLNDPEKEKAQLELASLMLSKEVQVNFKNDDFVRALINSIGICVIATFIALLFGTMAAYAIARLDFPGKRTIVAVSLLVSMFPQIALVTPLFKIETALGLFDTFVAEFDRAA